MTKLTTNPRQIQWLKGTLCAITVVCLTSLNATSFAQSSTEPSPFRKTNASSIPPIRSLYATKATPGISSAGNEAFTEPIETIKIASSELGIIGKVKVKRGDEVSVNDLLFELDMTVLEASRRLALAKANSKARLKSAEVNFEAKTKSYQKRVELLRDRAGSPEEVEKAKTEADLAQQNIEAILEENEQFALETKRIESQMEQRRIRSPIAGVVVDVRKKPGEYVASNDPHIATIVQLDTLRAVFYLPTSRAVKINKGDTAELTLTETDQKAKGIVEYVAPVTDADSGRVRIEILIDNKFNQFRSGVRCRIRETMPRQSMIDPPVLMKGPLSR